jgi:hypothetical protein
MDRATVERWREALEKKGLDVVRHQLDLRPGRPDEVLYNIVDEPPYPDRAFCEDWCRGAPPPPTAISGTGAMVIIMSILVIVCVLRGFVSFSTADPDWLAPNSGTFHQASTAAPARQAGGSAGSAGPASSIQNTAAQNGSVVNTTEQGSMLPSCTSVSAGSIGSVQKLPSCSKLGQPFVKQSSGPHS